MSFCRVADHAQSAIWQPCTILVRPVGVLNGALVNSRAQDHEITHAWPAVLCLLVHDDGPPTDTTRDRIKTSPPREMPVDRSYHPLYGRCYVAC